MVALDKRTRHQDVKFSAIYCYDLFSRYDVPQIAVYDVLSNWNLYRVLPDKIRVWFSLRIYVLSSYWYCLHDCIALKSFCVLFLDVKTLKRTPQTSLDFRHLNFFVTLWYRIYYIIEGTSEFLLKVRIKDFINFCLCYKAGWCRIFT